jgi:hypothetical protein
MTTRTERATDTADTMAQGVRDEAQRAGEQTSSAWQRMREEPTPKGVMAGLEQLPATAYVWATFGSIGLSLLLRLVGRKDFATFVGLWPSTIVALALLNKQLRPSREL